MFCKNCGNQLNDDAAFCNNCGTPVGDVGVSFVQESKKVVDDGQVKVVLQPTFIGGYQLIMMIWNIFLTMLFLGVFLLDLGYIFRRFPFWGFVIVFIVTIWHIVAMLFKKAQYNKIRYNFYNTKVEYVDGFLNKEEKEVKYKYIREVTMTQNVVERFFGIGCIRLYTNASSAVSTSGRHSQTGKNGIVIHCVKNLKENLSAVKALIDAADEE
ncbi:MAG: PH domain-containing protein [Clostridia bacterium]|jgi:uncharacterized membrane protein YdbT with pleckstrin-like domain|nr:PH domain-containing protein [Clostridia bacterium]